MPPTPTYHNILLKLGDIQAIPETLLTIFSVTSFEKTISGNITATILDHLPQLLISPNKFVDPPSNESNVFESDWSNVDQENFVLDYFDIDWPNIFKLDEKSVNSATNNFLDTINSVLDKYSPLNKKIHQ